MLKPSQGSPPLTPGPTRPCLSGPHKPPSAAVTVAASLRAFAHVVLPDWAAHSQIFALPPSLLISPPLSPKTNSCPCTPISAMRAIISPFALLQSWELSHASDPSASPKGLARLSLKSSAWHLISFPRHLSEHLETGFWSQFSQSLWVTSGSILPLWNYFFHHKMGQFPTLLPMS